MARPILSGVSEFTKHLPFVPGAVCSLRVGTVFCQHLKGRSCDRNFGIFRVNLSILHILSKDKHFFKEIKFFSPPLYDT